MERTQSLLPAQVPRPLVIGKGGCVSLRLVQFSPFAGISKEQLVQLIRILSHISGGQSTRYTFPNIEVFLAVTFFYFRTAIIWKQVQPCLKICSLMKQLLKLSSSYGKPFSTATANVLSLCFVREISPGIHTFFPAYTCSVYCRRSVQLLDFALFSDLIPALQPIRTTFTGQRFASIFLQTPLRSDALDFGCILPTAGRIWDFHPLERALAGRTTKK